MKTYGYVFLLLICGAAQGNFENGNYTNLENGSCWVAEDGEWIKLISFSESYALSLSKNDLKHMAKKASKKYDFEQDFSSDWIYFCSSFHSRLILSLKDSFKKGCAHYSLSDQKIEMENIYASHLKSDKGCTGIQRRELVLYSDSKEDLSDYLYMSYPFIENIERGRTLYIITLTEEFNFQEDQALKILKADTTLFDSSIEYNGIVLPYGTYHKLML